MHLLQLGTWKVYAVSRGAELGLDELPQGADKNLVHVQVGALAMNTTVHKSAFCMIGQLCIHARLAVCSARFRVAVPVGPSWASCHS